MHTLYTCIYTAYTVHMHTLYTCIHCTHAYILHTLYTCIYTAYTVHMHTLYTCIYTAYTVHMHTLYTCIHCTHAYILHTLYTCIYTAYTVHYTRAYTCIYTAYRIQTRALTVCIREYVNAHIIAVHTEISFCVFISSISRAALGGAGTGSGADSLRLHGHRPSDRVHRGREECQDHQRGMLNDVHQVIHDNLLTTCYGSVCLSGLQCD